MRTLTTVLGLVVGLSVVAYNQYHPKDVVVVIIGMSAALLIMAYSRLFQKR
jgi:uncharacterized membrane protein YccC